MSIDWSKAPDWAKEFGRNPYRELAWLGDPGYSYFIGNGSVVSWGHPCAFIRSNFEIIEAHPVEWTGEGLPPVGIEIEAFMMRNMHDTYEWRRAKVVHGGIPGSEREILVYDLESTAPAWVDEFRPVRTPEQIAADELRGIIESGLNGRKTLTAVVEEIQAAGYRKQTSP